MTYVIRNEVANTGDSEPLRVLTRTIGRRCVVALDGELDLAAGARFDEALDRAMDDGAVELCIDLVALEFMDSTGVRSLLRAQARCDELQRRLVVVCPLDTATRRLLKITRVDELVEVHDTLRAALA